MMQGLYISSAGMQALSDGLGIVGNNLANVSTVGFKQQLLLFQDFASEDLLSGTAFDVEYKQIGLGSELGPTRTLFTSGALASADNVTDLGISGDGFFQLQDENNEIFYTRAGNFHFDSEGVMRSPGNLTLMGIPIEDGVEGGELTEIVLNSTNESIATSPPKATSSIIANMNLYSTQDQYSDDENPYFSMIQEWNGLVDPPLSGVDSVPITFYDSAGVKQSLQLYFDKATSVDGSQVYEYVLAVDPELDARAGYVETESAGLLMSGTMKFTPAGELENMNYFSPTGTDLTDPASWTLSTLTGGNPSISLTLPDQEAQTIQLNLGLQAGSDTWVQSNGDTISGALTGADIGTNYAGLPLTQNPTYNSNFTTSMATSTSLKNLDQDGYGVGALSNMEIDSDGIVRVSYTNGESEDLYRIPLVQFTSEDGLRREGDNLYTHTDDAGQIYHGTAGTENYGSIYSHTLEQSNVDMAKEMVNMIIVQRGFQSNSKSVQSIDTMIQKAIEMKR